MARPLKMASWPDMSTTLNALGDGAGAGTFGFHPRIVPDSPANRNSDGPESPMCETTKPDPPLKTVPVGAPNTFTTNGSGVPVPSYNVEVSVPLFATHQGVCGPATSPHAFLRFGS